MENLIGKSGPLEIYPKFNYHRQQSSICFGEILQFHRRSLGPPMFQNELGKGGMAHRKLGWTTLMMYVLITSSTHAVKVRWWLRHPETTDADLMANLKP